MVKKIKAKKIFCVVAYDIESDKIRLNVSKLLEKYGVRINYSVFECLFTDKQLKVTEEKIRLLIHSAKDSVVFYRICVDCYTKTIYCPQRKIVFRKVEII